MIINKFRYLIIVVAIISIGILCWGEQEVLANANTINNNKGYLYTSDKYSYAINCPHKPIGVIPANEFYENRNGDILIFDNEGYYIKNAWVILTDAFTDEAIPDLNKIDSETAANLLKDIMTNNGYEGIMLFQQTEANKAIYAITAKEVDIDEDGDGTIDFVAKTDNQLAVIFFRGNKGNRFSIQLIDNPELREETLRDFQTGVRSFIEI